MTATNFSKRWRRQDLCYCANVHPVGSLEELGGVVEKFVGGVRLRRRLDTMGAGLWLAATVAEQLIAESGQCRAFSDLLQSNDVRLFTLNGFPFGNFHSASVKERVYIPDWSQVERYRYTQNLARILAACLPDDVAEGTISTLPLGYRYSWTASQQRAAVQALCNLAQWLAELKQTTGRSIRVCLEMEPDCVLETTDEMIDFFHNQLLVEAQTMGIAVGTIELHLGVCFDICHQAVMFEDIEDSMARLSAAGIAIGKIQVSSALQLRNPSQATGLRVLGQFDEPKYLHQVRSKRDHEVVGVIDLGQALASSDFPRTEAWRIHFHVPIQALTLAHEELDTTQDAIGKALDFLATNPDCRPHLEVETYTWQVLPADLRPHDDQALIQGLTAELDWLEQAMVARDLLA